MDSNNHKECISYTRNVSNSREMYSVHYISTKNSYGVIIISGMYSIHSEHTNDLVASLFSFFSFDLLHLLQLWISLVANRSGSRRIRALLRTGIVSSNSCSASESFLKSVSIRKSTPSSSYNSSHLYSD